MGYLYKRGEIWWMKYYVNGRPRRESTNATKEEIARRVLKVREGAIANGVPLPPRVDRILYDELAADLRKHYQTTGRRRLAEVDDRLHYLTRFFRGCRATSIGPARITEYVAARQAMTTKLGGPRFGSATSSSAAPARCWLR